MNYVDFFKQHIANKNALGVLNLWKEYCLVDDPGCDEITTILGLIYKSNMSNAIVDKLESGILILLRRLEREDDVWEVLRHITRHGKIQTPELLVFLSDKIEAKFSNHDRFEANLRIIDLPNAKGFKAVDQIELLHHIKEHNLVHHKPGWGVGEIIKVSINGEHILIDFENATRPISMSFHAASNSLLPLEETSFWAKRLLDPEGLWAIGNTNPERLICGMLKETGALSYPEIKDCLLEYVVPSKNWNNWWNKTRNIMKRSSVVALINTPTGKQWSICTTPKSDNAQKPQAATLTTSTDPLIEPDERMLALTAIDNLLQALKPKNKRHQPEIQDLKERINMELEHHAETSSERFTLLLFLSTIEPNIQDETLIQHARALIFELGIAAFLGALHSDYAKKVVGTYLVLHATQIGLDAIAKLFFSVEGKPHRLAILKAATLNKKLMHKIEDAMFYNYDCIESNASAFTWLLQHKYIPDNSANATIIQQALIKLDILHRQDTSKEIKRKLISLLKADHYALIRQVFAISTKEEIQDTLLIANKSCVFPMNEMALLKSLANAVHPFVDKPGSQTNSSGQHIIWTSKTGYQKAYARLKEISDVEMLELAKEIEIARAYGDLRENFEYKSALEKRSRLQREMSSLSKNIQEARIIHAEDVTISVVSVGTSVELVEAGTNDFKIFTILGPWDTAPQKGIISFQSGIANKLMGKKIGDLVDVNNKTYFIKNISMCEILHSNDPSVLDYVNT